LRVGLVGFVFFCAGVCDGVSQLGYWFFDTCASESKFVFCIFELLGSTLNYSNAILAVVSSDDHYIAHKQAKVTLV
jgi:hypothetical protein